MTENNKLIRPQKLAQMLDVDLVTIWRWRKQNKIPQPIALGGRLIAWRELTIEEWLSKKEKS
ncbi:helix-turn-helix transcriptional regulator [Colwellia psychrerythraea]|jgi:prophage regulatory protein|uniref:Phage transcriptional regulator, AlpA n=1 Tax=Colwellia psychrerythraea TaxID=28229 RepID=A0A099KYA7_COLPS|nr:AlpA family phage regulatory protein [Colwellia psychrerythraea]KGJ95576.1 phage transcriptional regulator, AlpA [Colwellia psychrerythraea]